MPLLFLEFLGTTELLVILVVALVLFGPRKLPQIGQSIGKSLSEFKRASEDFKRTWEMEVEMERADIAAKIENPLQPESPASPTYSRSLADNAGSDSSYYDPHSHYSTMGDATGGETATAETDVAPAPIADPQPVETAPAAARKHDWL